MFHNINFNPFQSIPTCNAKHGQTIRGSQLKSIVSMMKLRLRGRDNRGEWKKMIALKMMRGKNQGREGRKKSLNGTRVVVQDVGNSVHRRVRDD